MRPDVYVLDWLSLRVSATGALDTKTTNEIMHLMQDLNRQGITVVVITHEDEVAAYASRQIHFRDGRIESDSAHPDLRRASGARQ